MNKLEGGEGGRKLTKTIITVRVIAPVHAKAALHADKYVNT